MDCSIGNDSFLLNQVEFKPYILTPRRYKERSRNHSLAPACPHDIWKGSGPAPHAWLWRIDTNDKVSAVVPSLVANLA